MIFLDSKIQLMGCDLPTRSIVIDVNGKRLIISPCTKLKEEDLLKLGKVDEIIAPNLFHHLGINKAKKAFPNAELWAPKGMKEKRPDINWTKTFFEDEWPYQNDLEIYAIEGIPKFNEVLFYHKPSKTLIVTDLFFNLKNQKKLKERIIFGIFGTYNRFNISRLFKLMINDKQAFSHSIEKIKHLEIDRLVMAHGEIIHTNAKEYISQFIK